jgi:hypothetical protein
VSRIGLVVFYTDKQKSGVGVDGSDTFLPRVLVYDAKSSFGNLRQTNALYELQDETRDPIAALRQAPTVIRQPAIPAHPYQNHVEEPSEPAQISASDVRFWSDYNRVYYHPRSLVQLETTTLASGMAPFQSWEFGNDLFLKEDAEHDLLDRDFRVFAEECDQMQGVSVYAGMDDAWASFSQQYLERLRDELGKTTIWVWGVPAVEEASSNIAVSLPFELIELIDVLLGLEDQKTTDIHEIPTQYIRPSFNFYSTQYPILHF